MTFYLKEDKILTIAHKFYQAEPSINDTNVLEKDNSLPFRDILLINNNNKL